DTSTSWAITDMSLLSKTLVLAGPLVGYTATVVSSLARFDGLSVHAYIVQQNVRHAVGEQALPCGSGTTSCTFTGAITASGGSGLLPGAATFELQLIDAQGAVLSTREVGMTLVSSQTISAVNLASDTLVLGGPLTSYKATLQNPDSTLSGVAVQGWIAQTGANIARRAAGGAAVQCGGATGVLPTGTCTLSSVLVASNSTAGTGTLVLGAAMFELDLMVNGTVVAQRTVPVVLTSSATIAGLSLSFGTSDTLLLESPSVPYFATLRNVGTSLSGISLEGWVSQGTARRFAGGGAVVCGSGSGVLPNGTCTIQSQLTATNNTSGTGTLSTGAATFELRLVDASGAVLSTAILPLYLIDGPLESPPPSPGSDADRTGGPKGPRVARP
ncbi:MAG TPA: hypothetical protein VFJ20_13205, partial [Gemmatimonadaceae bacterium]|nr:hypothetical protein [Gemmatimonadaceae bacterium]